MSLRTEKNRKLVRALERSLVSKMEESQRKFIKAMIWLIDERDELGNKPRPKRVGISRRGKRWR